MAKQITVLPEWASNQSANVTQPTTAKKQLGWVGGSSPEQPPADWVNWLHRTAYENLAFVSDQVYFGDLGRIHKMYSLFPSPSAFTPGSPAMFNFGMSDFTNTPYYSGGNSLYGNGHFQEQYATRGSLSLLVGGGWHTNVVSVATVTGAGVVFASFNGGRSWAATGPAPLSSCIPYGCVWSPVDGFVVASYARSTGRPTFARSLDLLTWNHSMDPVGDTGGGNGVSLYYWDAVSAYYNFNFYPGGLNRSVTGSISGAWGNFYALSSQNLVMSYPVTSNNRYMMCAGHNINDSNAPHVVVCLSATPAATSFTWALKPGFTAGTFQQLGVSYQNGMFIVKGYVNTSPAKNFFCILDGTTGIATNAAHWTSLTVAGDILPPELFYDSKRNIWVAHRSKFTSGVPFVYVSQNGLVGPWRQIFMSNMDPIVQSTGLNPNLGSYFRVIKSQDPNSYLNESYLGLVSTSLIASDFSPASLSAVIPTMVNEGERAFF